jgi:hypothetical protein
MIKYVYITSSSYSGSTLLTFLLNAHPRIITAGEMDGWPYEDSEKFLCSCGKPLQECPFFRFIAESLSRDGLPFDFRNFGTRYYLFANERVNRWLTAGVSRLHSSRIEHMRDRLIWRLPVFSRKLRDIDRINYAFVNAALEYCKTDIFVDSCKDPFRLRHLRRIEGYDFRIIYLYRNPKGVVHSTKKHKGWSITTCTRLWLHQQYDISRILDEFSQNNIIMVSYEDLCRDTGETMTLLFNFLDVNCVSIGKNLRLYDHHILGNKMRLNDITEVSESKNWLEFSPSELRLIEDMCLKYITGRDHSKISDIVTRYLQDS